MRKKSSNNLRLYADKLPRMIKKTVKNTFFHFIFNNIICLSPYFFDIKKTSWYANSGITHSLGPLFMKALWKPEKGLLAYVLFRNYRFLFSSPLTFISFFFFLPKENKIRSLEPLSLSLHTPIEINNIWRTQKFVKQAVSYYFSSSILDFSEDNSRRRFRRRRSSHRRSYTNGWNVQFPFGRWLFR